MPSKIKYLTQLRPQAGRAYFEFLEESVQHLDKKTHFLIALSNKVVGDTLDGFRFYVKKAKDYGATTNEIVDSVMVALASTPVSKVLAALEVLEEMGIVDLDHAEGTGNWMRLADLEEIPEGRIGYFEWEGKGLLTWREGNEVKVFDHRCPHQGSLLVPGNSHGSVIECRLHKWRFDVASGQCIGPGTKGLIIVPCRITDGVLEVHL